ncbi:hypothetical protein [Microbacterium suwonense]|uniref:Uncharacterized protein n=1 Tax=Microbacterium suwonense TaxID=683047 RepID=A0ABN6X284_9MICO|nr:hypothetical protein [Microbacterium suwonense]BDZ38072.1 hypothetical protein GCM10025863_06860 [Microbacterium suwonense]
MDPISFDFSGVTDALAALGPAVVGAGAAVIAAGVGVAAVMWGAPKLIGLFKKTAK